MSKLRVACGIGALAVGLGSAAQGCGTAEDAGVERAANADAAVGARAAPIVLAASLARADATLDGFLKRSARGIEASGAHLTSPGWRGVGASANRIAARLPSKANAPLQLGLGPDASRSIRVVREGASDTEAVLEGGQVVYPEAYPATDLVVAATTERYEELLVLKDATAPRQFGFQVALPEAIPNLAAQPDGTVLFTDASGQPAIVIDRPFALDAKGVKRDAKLRVEGDRIVLDLDTSGLEYPVLLDPAYDVAVWQLVVSTAPPAGRGGHAMAFHAASSVILMMGGYNGSAYLNDAWTFNGTAWSSASAGPSARRYHSMAYDAARNETVLFGGVAVIGGITTPYSDTWVYSGGTWTEKCGACAAGVDEPIARYGHTLTYDSTLGRVLLFGGNASGGPGYDNQIWEWNGTTAKWTQRCTGAACVASAPTARTQHGMAYDAHSARTVVYGGNSAGGLLMDTRLYDSAADLWSNPGPATNPGARQQHTMTYDSVRQRVMLFGGRDPSSSLLDDTWQWDGAAWSKPFTATGTGPQARFGTSLVFNPVMKKSVLFSGCLQSSCGTAPSETHTLYIRGDSCSNGTTCDTGYCVDSVCCTTASCGTCQRCDGGSAAGMNSGTCVAVLSADDPGTCSGNNTCDATGACKKAQGQVCSANSECATGNCVDGRCCQTGSCGTCASCANSAGTCTTVVVNQDDDSCTGNNTCNATGVCKKKSGQGCTLATECASNYCVDGTCCANDCTTACRSCANTAGTCTTVVSNQEDGTACNGINTCDSAGNCKKKTGQGCSAGSECANGNCADNYCCDTACAGGCDVCSAAAGASQNGTCTVLGSGSAGQCGAYKCGGSAACPTTCSSDASCTAGNYCAGNACTPKKGLGEQCTAGSQCALGNCVDGVCCDGTCTGKCMACAAGNKEDASMANNGKCGASKKGSNPGSQCVASSDPCGDQASCSGTPGECAKGAAGTSCGPTTCSNGAVSGKICNGAGACVDQTNAQCAPYVCKGAACSSPCTADTDCVTTPQPHYCSNGVCIPKIDNGKTCTAAASCKSGFCIDQVCCDAPCNGQCEACAETGTLGQCTPVTGKPRGTRTDCAGTAGDKCKGTCDGANKSACAYPAAGTACKDAACTGDVSQPAGTCDGAGLCSQLSTKNCLPYGCNAASGVCNTTCASDTECAQGAKCDTNTGKCAVTSATCKDATTVLLPNGQSESCVPYKCVGGACQQQCSTTTDCADGYICQGSSCVAAEGGTDSGVGGGSGAGGSSSGGSSTGGSSTGGAGGTAGKKSDSGGDEGGCGCRVPSKGAGSSAYWLAALGLAVLRRRRRNGQTVSERAGAER